MADHVPGDTQVANADSLKTSLMTSDSSKTVPPVTGAPDSKDPQEVTVSHAYDAVKPVSLRGLFRYATWFDRLLLFIGTFAALGYGLCQPMSMVVTGALFDAYGLTSVGDAAKVAVYFVYIGIAVIFSATTQMICFNLVAARMTARVQTAFFEAILKHDVTYYDLHGASAGLASVASSNMALFKSAIGQKLGMAIQNFSLMLSSFVIGFTYAWQLSLVILAFCPLIGAGGYFFGSQSAKFASEQLKAYSVAGAVIDEALGSIRTVTSLSMQHHFVHKMKDSLTPVTKRGRRAGLLVGLGMALLVFGYQVSFSPSYYVGAVLVVNARDAAYNSNPVSNPPPSASCAVGQVVPLLCNTQKDSPNLTFATQTDVCNCALCLCGCYSNTGTFETNRCITGGDVLLVFFSVIIGGFGLGQFFPNYQSIQMGRTGAARIFEIIDSTAQIENRRKVGEQVTREAIRGELKFENAVFAYPSRPDVDVLQGTNLTIPAGKRIAICGASGSGKSSIVSLVLRFYDLKSGKLTLDGVDVTELDTDSLRSCIGLVSQEPVLFAGVTIKENVRYGKPSATDDEVEAACKMANAHDFIMQFPSTYDTVLVGSSLSGGQKQRIAIARALIRDPRVLILDEASAALDSESERLVNEAIDQVVQNTKRTVIVVAHRLSTIRTCERIVMMGPGGRVIEEGTHEDLMSNKGAYYNMNMAAEKTEKEEKKKIPSDPISVDTKTEISEDDDDDDEVESADITMTTQGKDPSKDGLANEASVSKDVAKAGKSKKKKKSKSVSLRRVFRFSYPERWYFIPAIVASGINGAVDPFLALTFSRIIPAMYFMNNGDVLSAAALYAWIFFGLGCIKGIVTIISNWCFGIISAEMTTRVRVETFAHLLRMEMAYFDEPKHNIGAMSQKLAKDAALVKASIGDYSNVMSTVVFGLITGLVIAFIASWKLTLVVFALFPVMGVGFAVDAYFKGGGGDRTAKSESAAAQTFSEAISGFRTVCAFNLRTTLVDLYSTQLAEGLPIEKKGAYVQGCTFGFSQSIQFFSYAIMFYYSAVLLNDGEITFQDMLQSLLAIVFTASNAGNAFALSPDVSKGQSAVKSIFSVLDRPSKIDPLDPKGLQPSAVMGDLKFENVAFAYPSRKEYPVLKDFSFNVPRGTILALVGESGSGKSTIIQLLERFYDADHGRVLLDGNTTDELNVMWLRSRIGLVSQEPVLFDDTIYNNIKYGLGPDAAGKSEAEITAMIETAAKDANAYDFIMRLPEQFQTKCGQKGGQLSGGQKQRIAISRALVRDPDVLLCDEATSALDEESQRTVQDALDRLLEAKKRTVIIIAHRLTTVQRADVILVLRKGEVVETGSYNELAEREGGQFRALLVAQGGAH